MPTAVDVVAVGVGGAQHVRGGHARDVVLGRLAAEEHDEVDAVGRRGPAGRSPPDGTRPRPGTCRPACGSRPASVAAEADRWASSSGLTSAARRAPRSTPARCGRASCSCRSWPSATATTSSPRRSRRARRPTSPPAPLDGGLGDRDRGRRHGARRLLDLGRWAPRPAARPTAVVGITGSVGKTSTKDLTAAALGARCGTAANERSLQQRAGGAAHAPRRRRRHRGARAGDGHARTGRDRAAVRRSAGRPSASSPWSPPRTPSGSAALDGVARAKAELVEALPADGTAVLNADDPRVAAMAARTAGRVLTFGRSPSADVAVADLSLSDDEARARASPSSRRGGGRRSGWPCRAPTWPSTRPPPLAVALRVRRRRWTPRPHAVSGAAPLALAHGAAAHARAARWS